MQFPKAKHSLKKQGLIQHRVTESSAHSLISMQTAFSASAEGGLPGKQKTRPHAVPSQEDVLLAKLLALFPGGKRSSLLGYFSLLWGEIKKKWSKEGEEEKEGGKKEGGRRGDPLTLKIALSYLLPRQIHIVTFP